jgi:hypothetical protein
MKYTFTDGWTEFLNTHQISAQRKSMKDLLWERSENWKVDRMIFERALLEGRKEDVLKKYPHYANQIENYFTGENDPSGNNKYLSKMVKLLHTGVQNWKKRMDVVDQVPVQMQIDAETNIEAEKIKIAVRDFHKLNKYMPTAQGGRDLNSYKYLGDINQALTNAEAVVQRKELEKVHKEKLRADADRIYQDKTTLVVRPNSEEASCYYGQGTQWCIAATNSRNYWDDYSNDQGAVFFFILDKDEQLREDQRDKVALVYDTNHDGSEFPMDAYDTVDDQLDSSDITGYWEDAWSEEKIRDVFNAIQQSLDKDPPEPGVDLEQAVVELQEYAHMEFANTEAAENISVSLEVDYEDTGIMAYGSVFYELALNDKRNPRDIDFDDDEAWKEESIREAIGEVLSQDYEEADIEFDALFVKIRLDTNCSDCYGGESREARERAVEGTRDFIDGMVNSYADDYKKEKEELRRTLVDRKVIGPSEWDFKKRDIKAEVEKLPHFTSRDLGDLILFELVEEGTSAPIIGKLNKKSEEIYTIFAANHVTDRGYKSENFNTALRTKLNKYFQEAKAAAAQQMSLSLGDKYEKPKDAPWNAYSFDIYLVPDINGETRMKLQYPIGEGRMPSYYLGALKSLNDNYDQIVKSAREVFEEMVGKQKVKLSKQEEEVYSGKEAMELIRLIDGVILASEMNDERREANVAVLKWFQENFEKMTPVERKASTSYLTKMRQHITNGITGLYKIEDGKDVPIRFEDEVRSKMEDIGAQVRTRGEYKWSGKRDDLVESIRNRVRQVIAESLKK